MGGETIYNWKNNWNVGVAICNNLLGVDKFTHTRLKIHAPLGTNSTPRAHVFISTLLILYLGKISHGVNEFFHDPCWTPYLQHFNAGSKFKSVEHRVRRSYSLSYTQIQHSRNARPIYQNNNPKASSQSLSDEVHTLFSFTDRKLMFAWSVKQKLLFLSFGSCLHQVIHRLAW